VRQVIKSVLDKYGLKRHVLQSPLDEPAPSSALVVCPVNFAGWGRGDGAWFGRRRP
jgi:hypothetical protein